MIRVAGEKEHFLFDTTEYGLAEAPFEDLFSFFTTPSPSIYIEHLFNYFGLQKYSIKNLHSRSFAIAT